MTKMESYIERYIEIELKDYDTFHDRINTRIERFGAYRYLESKTKDEIKQLTHTDIAKIFNGLYSTQRPNVMDSLLEILNADGGVSYFRGIFNQLKDRKQDIDDFHSKQKAHIQDFKRRTGNYKLVFGKNTISQIAHFCKPMIYPISNTKSQKVILKLLNQNVENDYEGFVQIANKLCTSIQNKCEEVFQMKLEVIFKREKYIILDDFIEFVYERI